MFHVQLKCEVKYNVRRNVQVRQERNMCKWNMSAEVRGNMPTNIQAFQSTQKRWEIFWEQDKKIKIFNKIIIWKYKQIKTIDKSTTSFYELSTVYPQPWTIYPWQKPTFWTVAWVWQSVTPPPFEKSWLHPWSGILSMGAVKMLLVASS